MDSPLILLLIRGQHDYDQASASRINNEICLTETKVKLTSYRSNESLKLLGKFKTLIEYEDKQIDETIYVVDTPEKQRKCSLLSKRAAESLGIIITFNIDRQTVMTVEQNEKQISPKLQNRV